MAKVFISYRQLGDTQRERVRIFAERLRGFAIDVVLDQFYQEANPGGPPEGWPQWSSNHAVHTPQVLIIGNEAWFRCFDGTEEPGTGLGAACEAGSLRQRLYDAGGKNEIVRVVFFCGGRSRSTLARTETLSSLPSRARLCQHCEMAR